MRLHHTTNTELLERIKDAQGKYERPQLEKDKLPRVLSLRKEKPTVYPLNWKHKGLIEDLRRLTLKMKTLIKLNNL